MMNRFIRKYVIGIAVCCAFASVLSCTRHADADAQSLYEEGKRLREAERQVEAMQCFLNAAHSGTKDEALLGRVWSNMANMCRLANEHVTAAEVYRISASHFAASGDTLAYAYALNNVAWELAVNGHKDSVQTLVDEIRALPLSDVNRLSVEEKVRESHAAACLFAQEYDSVLYWTAPPANDYLLTLRAQAFSYLNENDSATTYARLLLPRTSNLFALDDLYYILTHNDASADKDSVLVLASRRADIQKLIENRHSDLAQAVQLLEQDLSRERSLWTRITGVPAVMVGIVLTLLALVVYLRWRKEQSAHTRNRRKELDSSLRVLQEAQDIREETAWDDYTELCRRTDMLFHGLASRLQAQGLNEQDIRICLLALIGMSHKETAELLNCSSKSVGKLKDITARKLGVSGGQLQDKLEKLAII